MSVKEEIENFVEINRLKNSQRNDPFNEKIELLKDIERLKKQKHKLVIEKEILNDKLIASHQEKSDLDLHNRRLASANQDLKRQNRKLEEENIALKERVNGLNEQLTLQPQKPQ
ncbi:hypothetical protein HpRN195_07050 [Helicobacter pylori]